MGKEKAFHDSLEQKTAGFDRETYGFAPGR